MVANRRLGIEITSWLTYALCGHPQLLDYPVTQQESECLQLLSPNLPVPHTVRCTTLKDNEKEFRRQPYLLILQSRFGDELTQTR